MDLWSTVMSSSVSGVAPDPGAATLTTREDRGQGGLEGSVLPTHCSRYLT
jgi:hypothetical protein